ncbi:hypothetical protein [Peribacillus muralis]|uniref:hypothetical protein n=1 Tax=Peribacillus muralis TaxID=264697 RepID=UPI00366A61A5
MNFNRNEIKLGGTIWQPSADEISNTMGLWGASLEDALKYGGNLTRSAIGAMNLKFDKKYIVVDTKIHMLMPNFSPAIVGWHTDGVPRGTALNPQSKGNPNIQAQETLDDTRFHLLVTGEGCLTQFVKGNNISLEVPDVPDTSLYKSIDSQVKAGIATGELEAYDVPSCTAVEFDWWDLHTGTIATKHEWRYLIRVTESDIMPPQKDLRKIIRTQQNIYLPHNFGW